MKVSDYIASFLVREGIHHVFVVSGGAAVHMIDSVARNPLCRYICSQHEQHAGASADGYARVSNNMGAVIVTSGPGATNLATSIANAYFDSIPLLLLCGQVATFRLKKNPGLRQKGFQETEVVSMFKPITKYATRLSDPAMIRFELEKAVFLARSGRKGPVLLDIPDDISRTQISEKKLKVFVLPKMKLRNSFQAKYDTLYHLLNNSKRPVLIYGAGIGLSNSRSLAEKFGKQLGIPIVHTWGGTDVLNAYEHNHIGAVGVCGPRASNFAVQNSDLIIAIGTRLSQQIIGKPTLFAPGAKKVIIDIDREEFNKFSKNELTIDLTIETDVKSFFENIQITRIQKNIFSWNAWLSQIHAWKETYPICPQNYYKAKKQIQPYVFVQELTRAAKPGAIIVTDTGANLSWTCQTWELKKKQRVISAWNHTPMGYALPGAIGASFAARQDVLCLIGDGGLMMCLSELQTVVFHKLPIKIFIFNNHGHSIQKQTLDTWLESRYHAVNEKSGLSFPDFTKIGKAFGIPTVTLNKHAHLKQHIASILHSKGPTLINVEIDPEAKIIPMLTYGSGLEDLSPKLPPSEIAKIMKISADLGR
jgi:acetolactate synthase-1/2/3 large subunit